MTPTQLHARILIALALGGCTVQAVDSVDEGPSPGRDVRVAATGAAVLPAAQPMAFKLIDGPYVLGDVAFQLQAPAGTPLLVLAAHRGGSDSLLGVPTALSRPVVVAASTASGEMEEVRAHHGVTAERGAMLVFQVVSTDGLWRSEVVSGTAEPFERVCGAGPFERLAPRAIICDDLGIPGQCAAPEDLADPYGVTLAALGSIPLGTTVTAVCPEVNATASCCYMMQIDQPEDIIWDTGEYVLGRPFRVGGEARQSTLRVHDSHDPLLQEVLTGWTGMAREEHASVAAFARFTLELMQLGAPIGLIVDATSAQADEVRHTQLCLAMAERLSGAPLVLGALPMDGALDGRDLRTVTLDVVREGCINETVSALIAMEARDRATDPMAKAALSTIAEDESRHAELSWRFVRWALDQDASLRTEVMAILKGFLPDVTVEPSANAAQLAAYGILDTHGIQVVAQRASRVVAACAASL